MRNHRSAVAPSMASAQRSCPGRFAHMLCSWIRAQGCTSRTFPFPHHKRFRELAFNWCPCHTPSKLPSMTMRSYHSEDPCPSIRERLGAQCECSSKQISSSPGDNIICPDASLFSCQFSGVLGVLANSHVRWLCVHPLSWLPCCMSLPFFH